MARIDPRGDQANLYPKASLADSGAGMLPQWDSNSRIFGEEEESKPKSVSLRRVLFDTTLGLKVKTRVEIRSLTFPPAL